MKNNKLIKATAGLALGLALLAPTTNESFATSSANTNAATVSSKDVLDSTIKKAGLKLQEYKNVKETYLYKNTTREVAKIDFDNFLNTLEDSYTTINSNYTKGLYKTDAQYQAATKELENKISYLEEKYSKLDGKKTDRSRLDELLDEEYEVRSSDKYRLAPVELQDAYLNAITNGKVALGKAADLTDAENESAVNQIVAAKEAIARDFEKKNLIIELRDKIKDTETIVKNKDVYTAKSYEVFNSARIAAITTHDNKESTYDQIKSALNALKSAESSLEKVKTSEDEKREKQIKDLRNAINENEKMVAAANYLLEETPKTVEGVKGKLQKLIKDANEKTAKGKKALAKLEGIRG